MTITVLIAIGSLLILASWTDIRYMLIPNIITVIYTVCGLVYQTVIQGWEGAGWALAGAAAGLVPLWLMFRFRGIGGGDVKLFGAMGVWMGPFPALLLLIYSLLIGGLIAVCLLALRLPVIRTISTRIKWPWGEHPVTAGKGTQFPFMLAVVPGFMILLWRG